MLKAALCRGHGRWLRCADGGRYHLILAHGGCMYVYERVCKLMCLCRIFMLDLVDAVRVIMLRIEGRLSKV